MTPATPTSDKLLLLVLLIFAVTNTVDYFFYGMLPHDLMTAIGLSVSAYGMWRRISLVSAVGAVMLLAGIAWKYLES
ncbi:hypothetical protein ICJ04_02025 [Stenotrophomonas sp. 169]|uniref:hypothetical protein n=1 Tax=Stenotrophomonas sp. 169 TaxID=2770322 RepID=UPI0016626FA3|nr:hypothetical protein [Stenotrophomonas sp. 169]QNR97721.1 hypothetical protein ICJ04_02025 [Stenotrophomonas sp. 169]